MRVVKAALFGILAAGCAETASRDAVDPESTCRFVVRTPSEPVVMTWRDGAATVAFDRCGHARCVAGSPTATALLDDEGNVRLRVGDRDATFRAPDTPGQHHIAGVAVSRGGAWYVDGEDVVYHRLEHPDPLRLPHGLRAGEKVVGVARVGDDAYLLQVAVRRKDGRFVPTRQRWLVRPVGSVDDLTGNLFVRKRRILGSVERRADRWAWVDRQTGRETPLPVRMSEPPSVWPFAGGELATWDARGLHVVHPDGRSRLLGRDLVTMGVGDDLFLYDRKRGVLRTSYAADVPFVARAPGRDLAGAPLPPGAVVQRGALASDEESRLLVAERILLPTCAIDDRVHLIDVAAGRTTTLATGPRLKLWPTFAHGVPAWVESDADYRTVSPE